MKKIIVLSLFYLSVFSTLAQNDKGSFHVGAGGLPIIYPNSELPTGYALRMNVGYLFTENFSLGIMPFHGKVDDMKSTGANLFLRYYILKSKVSIFGEATSGWGILKYGHSSDFNGKMYSFTIGPGLAYSFHDKLSFEVLLQYGTLKNISFPEQRLGNNIFIPSIGLQYYFRK